MKLEKVYNHIWCIVRTSKHKRIFEQDLQILFMRYDLNPMEQGQVRCYLAEKEVEVFKPIARELGGGYVPKPKEDPKIKASLDLITNLIMKRAEDKAKKRRPKGWICGTHFNNVKRSVRLRVRETFDNVELDLLFKYYSEKEGETLTKTQLKEIQELLTRITFVPELLVLPGLEERLARYECKES